MQRAIRREESNNYVFFSYFYLFLCTWIFYSEILEECNVFDMYFLFQRLCFGYSKRTMRCGTPRRGIRSEVKKSAEGLRLSQWSRDINA